MSSNGSWTTQFDDNYSNTAVGQSESTGSWNCSTVNTPQTNPANWPQLGSSSSEAENSSPSMSQPQMQSTREETGWNVTNKSSVATGNEPDPNGTSAWGRLPDNNSKSSGTPSTGWGVPSSGIAWGQRQQVDDGTAVWGKSSSAQHQGNWGGQSQNNQGTESGTASGWGTTEPATSVNKESNSQNSSQQSLPHTNQTTTSSQPVSWAKAASAGLSTSSGTSESNSVEKEPETVDPTPTPVSQPSQPIAEPDPVHQLVNSHEGWGKKPIQQETSWNVTDTGQSLGRHPSTNSVSNGTEAWGKPSGGQLPSAPSWGDAASNKPSSGWGSSYNQPAAPSRNWGVPNQSQQPRPSFTPGWGDNMNTGRWNEGSGSNQTPAPTGWGGPPTPQQMPGTSSWGNMQSPTNTNPPSGWGNVPPTRPQGGNWGNNMMPIQSPVADQSWTRPADARRQSVVDNGTAAWGDPDSYSKVNMWEKSGKQGPGNTDGQAPNSNANIEPKGWGVPANQSSNRPLSPTGWNDARPNSMADNVASGWDSKPSDKWENKSNGANNWNQAKPNTSVGWGQPSEQRWGAPDNGANWTSMVKNEGMMKNNMEYGPRGSLPPQANQPPMLRNQMPPALPPQLHEQMRQIRHAVVNGIIPAAVATPHLMSPQHMQNLIQLIQKTTEFNRLQMQYSLLQQNKNLAPMIKQQQLDQYSRVLRQCHQQIEAQRTIIMQSVMQKPQQNPNKINGPGNGMDLNGIRTGPGGQSLISPLHNMSAMGQSLPSTSMSSQAGENKSRFINNWKRPGGYGAMGDNMQPVNQSYGDSPYGMSFRSNVEDHYGAGDASTMSDSGGNGMTSLSSLPEPASASSTSSDPSAALADIGPPEFRPGVPWKGFRHIDPEADPNITPGSVAIAKTMSVNTVRDADQVLNRDRSSLPEPTSAGINDDGNLGANGALPGNSVNSPASSLPNEYWKAPLTSQSSAFRSLKNQSWGNSGSSMDQSYSMQSTNNSNWSAQNQDNRGSWLILTNFSQQVDPGFIQSMCAQHGTVISFRPHYPIEEMALVKYRAPEEAFSAKKALNMFMAGSTMLVATVATEQEITNLMAATSGNSWSSSSGGGANRLVSGSGSTGGFMTQLPPRPSMGGPPDMGSSLSSIGGQQFWGNAPSNTPSGTSWAANMLPNLAWSGATGEEISRNMTPIHNLLPENLLGGEAL